MTESEQILLQDASALLHGISSAAAAFVLWQQALWIVHGAINYAHFLINDTSFHLFSESHIFTALSQ